MTLKYPDYKCNVDDFWGDCGFVLHPTAVCFPIYEILETPLLIPSFFSNFPLSFCALIIEYVHFV